MDADGPVIVDDDIATDPHPPEDDAMLLRLSDNESRTEDEEEDYAVVPGTPPSSSQHLNHYHHNHRHNHQQHHPQQRQQQREPYLLPASPGPSRTPSTTTADDAAITVHQTRSRDECDRRRPEEDQRRLSSMSTQMGDRAVAPFLREHIPGLYSPVSKSVITTTAPTTVQNKDPNSKYCYRHRPDSKCRRAADETKMGMIQSELDRLPAADQQAITHVWSLFSAAPAKHRDLMLQGIMTQCCFPQLSTVAREVQDQLKIDFITALPTEISFKILCYLDTVSLCKAAQVSRRWRMLADDDAVWHRMCEQHIDRKCTRCGWGLPLLERKRLRDWTRQRKLLEAAQSAKRELELEDDDRPTKRQRSEDAGQQPGSVAPRTEKRFRPWKSVYRDRFKVGSNWKYGRCSIKTFNGHQNGITCLQFNDGILATGSYDATIKIWDIDTGQEIRTLTGHDMGIRTLQFDDNKLISGSLDKTIKVWNWQTGECVSTIRGHTEGVITVNFDGSLLASGSIDKTIKIFDFMTSAMYTLKGHTDWVNHVRLDLASRTLFSASDDCTAKIWDLDTKSCIKTLEGHVGQVQQVLLLPEDFEPDDDPSAPGGDNTDSVSVASGRSGTPVPPRQAAVAPPLAPGAPQQPGVSHDSHVMPQSTYPSPPDDHTPSSKEQQQPYTAAAYGPSFVSQPSRPLPPRYILTAGLDNTLRLWDTATGRCVRTSFGHVEGIWALQGDTLRVVTGANDAVVKVWEPRSGKCERTFTGHAGPVTCVGLSDSHMASGGEDGEVRLYSFDVDSSGGSGSGSGGGGEIGGAEGWRTPVATTA